MHSCYVCQFFQKVKKDDTLNIEITVEKLKGRMPFTGNKIQINSSIVGFCKLRKMYITKDTINRDTCKERAVVHR